MVRTGECPACGASLSDEERAEEQCPRCGADLTEGEEQPATTADERSEEASRESLPASDPPAW
jgi:transcription initiation factor IIE alpha subunit